MGTGASKNPDGGSNGGEEREESLDQDGGQFYVSLKMENYRLKGELSPHVYGSVPLVGSWDSSKAVNFTHFWRLHLILLNLYYHWLFNLFLLLLFF